MSMEPNVSAANEDTSSPSASSNPFRNALHKFSKKKEKSHLGSSATSGFFSRASKGKDKQQGPLPGSVKQVSAGQLPPVWVTPVPAPPRYGGHVYLRSEDVVSNECSVEIAANGDAIAQQRARRGGHGIVRPLACAKAANIVDRTTEFIKGIDGYMPSKQDRREAMLQRKRQEYVELLQQYYYIPDTDRGAKEQTTLRQILVDIPRTNADVKLFQEERIHQLMERVLYTWAIRHPASGYVQGINDLLTPFLVVFLSAYVDEPQTCDLSVVSDESLQTVEADSYWCLTKLLDGIQDHYTFAQPGLQRMVQRMEELVHRCDGDLFKHIVEREGVQFVQFAFRWMNCLLMREVPLNAIIRLWDTYLCEDSGFESFHVYVCAAILMTFGEKLKTLEFQELVLFLQHLPTKDWVEDEIDPLLSRAFILQTYFADSPSHLS
ncbi:Gtpase-activating protein gyp1-like, partial [Globisporangium splendens]